MARDFSPRKRRSKSFLPPQQKFISQFFTPRSGISKEAVNFLVKPEKKARENSNLAFKETKGKLSLVKQDIDSTVSTGNLDQITSSPVAFTSARDIWRSQQSSTGELKEGNLYNNTVISTASSPTSSSSQPEKLEQNSITDFFHLGARGSYKQTLDTRVSSMKSSTNSTSLNSSSVRKSKKREHDHESSSKKRKLDRRKNAPPWPAIVSLDSEESDGDCRIVGVVHGTQTQGIDKEESIDAGCRDVDVSNKQEGACTNTTSQSSTSKSNRQTCSSTSKQSSRSTFGLVGKDSGESDDDLEDSDVNIASLPVEIMENIFCQLPVVDLMLNCVMVCHKWHDIIASESFIPWKKTYFRLKSRVSSCEDKINELLDRNQLLELDLFPLHLARFMSNFKRRVNPSLLLSLRQHSKFHLIASFLETCTSEPDKDPCPWSAASLLTLVSQTVYEVQEIVNCLVKSNCCLVQDILECFYCLASIFFVLETQNRIGSGPHYRVFYSLYLFENAFEATCASLGSVFDQNASGQQSLMRYRSASDRLQLTHEQVRIIKHDVSAGEIIKIVAFAGTGKTTTLIEYTKMRPMQKFLNVAYNKSIQEHAEKSFPRNVESRTVHSLAFRGVGYKYRHKLAPSLRLSAIMNVLPDKCGYLHARRVEDTLKNFIASTSDVVNEQHVPAVSRAAVGDGSSSGSSDSGKAIFGNHGANLEYLNSEKHIQNVVSHAELLWERMKDLGDREIPITHDGYLKVYQLSRPTLFGYDCLLIDEAQDCTPAASDVLLRQRCAKILVGDPHQQIYAFRGARNALQEVTGTHTFYLTQSFRFGPEIAYVAACVLDVLKGVRHKTLVGGAKPGSVLGERKGQLCIITRCNYTLFNEAVHVCCSKNSTRVAFVGGIKGLALDRVLDIHKLFTAGSNNGRLDIKDNLIKKFHSFAELKKYAKAASDAELLGKIKIVETHHVMLQLRIEKIKSKTCHNMQQADIVFSTAHKAKGLEFDTVRLTDDFLPGREMGMSIHDHQEDEKNLVYVAVSRAKKCLQLTTTVLNILREKKEHFLKLVSPTETTQHNASPVCVSCMDADDVSPRPPHVIVRKEDVILGGNIRMSGGVLGPSCALTQIPHLGCLVNPTLVKVKEPESEYEFEFEFE